VFGVSRFITTRTQRMQGPSEMTVVLPHGLGIPRPSASNL